MLCLSTPEMLDNILNLDAFFGIFNQHSICHNQCTATMLRIQKANAIGNIEWPYQRTGRRISSEKDQMGDKQGKRKEGWEGEKGVE